MKTKLLLSILLVLSIFAFTGFANNIIGGPLVPLNTSSSRTQYVPHKYSGTKKSIKELYRGSSHESALDAQIRNYRASAIENERVFGRPFRTDKNKISIKELIKKGIVKIILGKDGKQYLVENK